MSTHISPQDWQDLSAYLDQQLDASSQRSLEARLQREPQLRQALEEMRTVRLALRSAPRLRAPRNFTLTPEMAGARRPAQPYPLLRLAAVLASILFLVALVGDLIGVPGTPVSEPAMLMQAEMVETALVEEAASALMQEASALPSEEPLPAAKSAPEEPARKAAPTPTSEVMTLEAAPAAPALAMPAPSGTPTGLPSAAASADMQITETPPEALEEMAGAIEPVPEEKPWYLFGLERGVLRGIEIGLGLLALAAWAAYLFLRRPASGGG